MYIGGGQVVHASRPGVAGGNRTDVPDAVVLIVRPG